MSLATSLWRRRVPVALGCRVGNSSYDIEAANGGILTVLGNTLVQGPGVENNVIIDYGGESSQAVNSLVVTRNTFI
jgi:hypothetical protein